MAIEEFLAVFKGETGPIVKSIHEVKGKLTEMEAQAVESHGKMTALIGKVAQFGTAAVAGLAAAGVAGAAVSVKLAADFQTAMTRLETSAGEGLKATGMSIEALGAGIKRISSETGIAATDLANGMYRVASEGFHAGEGLKVLEQAAKAAKVGGADFETVANATAITLHDYHMQASDAAKVTDILQTTVQKGNLHWEDLAASMGTVLNKAAQSKIPLEEVGAAMATLTSHGIDAQLSSQLLGQAMIKLQIPTTKGAEALQEIGLKADSLSTLIGQGHLAGALQLLTEHIGKKFPEGGDKATQALAAIAGGTRFLQPILALTGQNAAEFTDNLNAMSKAQENGGRTQEAWAKVQGDFSFQLDRAKETVRNLAITIGTQLLPFLTQMAAWVGGHQKEIGDFAHAVGDDLKAAFAVLLDVVRVVGPPLKDVIMFMADHKELVIALLTVMLARLVAIKALNMASNILEMASAFRVFAGEKGVMAAVTALGGGAGGGASTGLLGALARTKGALGRGAGGIGAAAKEGEQGLLDFGKTAGETTATMGGRFSALASKAGPIGLTVAAVAGVGFALYELNKSPDWDAIDKKITDGLTKDSEAWFQAWQTGTGKIAAANAKFKQSLDNVAKDSPFANGMLAQALGITAKQFDGLGTSAQTVVSSIASDTPAVHAFYEQLQKDGGNTEAAVKHMGDSYNGIFLTALNNITDGYKRNQEAAKQAFDEESRQTDTLYEKALKQRDAIEKVSIAHGMSKAAADAAFATENPQGAKLIQNAVDMKAKLHLTDEEFDTLRQNDALPYIDRWGNKVIGTFGNAKTAADELNRAIANIGDTGVAVARKVDLVAGAVQRAAAAAGSSGGPAPPSNIPGHAAGGMAEGWSIVGEKGPELAFFKQPTQIFPNDVFRNAMASMRSSVSGAMGSAGAAMNAAGDAGTHIGSIVMNNVKHGIDIVTEIERAVWLSAFNARRIAPPALWPGEMEVA